MQNPQHILADCFLPVKYGGNSQLPCFGAASGTCSTHRQATLKARAAVHRLPHFGLEPDGEAPLDVQTSVPPVLLVRQVEKVPDEVENDAVVVLERLGCDAENLDVQHALEMVVLAMQRYTSLRVQEAGCLAIWNLVRAGGVADEGIVKVVLTALRRHPEDDSPKKAFGALEVLAPSSAALINVREIVSAMRLYLLCNVLQDRGCGILRHIAVSGATQIAEVGGVQVLVAAVLGHRSDIKVVLKALDALSKLAQRICLKDMIAFGVIDAVVVAMKLHAAHVRVQQRACHLLGMFSCSHVQSLADSGSIEVLLVAMCIHLFSLPLQLEVVGLLRRLSEVEEFRYLISAGVKVIVASLRTHTATLLRYQGMKLLANLSSGDAVAEMIVVAHVGHASPQNGCFVLHSHGCSADEIVASLVINIIQRMMGMQLCMRDLGQEVCDFIKSTFLRHSDVDSRLGQLSSCTKHSPSVGKGSFDSPGAERNTCRNDKAQDLHIPHTKLRHICGIISRLGEPLARTHINATGLGVVVRTVIPYFSRLIFHDYGYGSFDSGARPPVQCRSLWAPTPAIMVCRSADFIRELMLNAQRCNRQTSVASMRDNSSIFSRFSSSTSTCLRRVLFFSLARVPSGDCAVMVTPRALLAGIQSLRLGSRGNLKEHLQGLCDKIPVIDDIETEVRSISSYRHVKFGELLPAVCVDCTSVESCYGLASDVCLFHSAFRIPLNMTHMTVEREIDAIATIMWSHPQVEVQSVGCELLLTMSVSKEQIANSSAVGAVVAAMKSHPTAEDLNDAGCRVLRKFAEITAEHVGRCGGLGIVLGAMMVHLHRASLQAEGCAVVRLLAKDASCAKGAIEAVLEAMASEESLVLETACLTLQTLAWNDTARRRIEHLGGLEAVASAMLGQPSMALLERGLGVLAALASEEAHKVASNVVITLLRVQLDGALQKAGLCALQELMDSSARVLTVGQLEGVEVVMQLMRATEVQLDVVLLEMCCSALARLADASIHVERICTLDGLAVVVAAMNSDAKPQLQAACCNLLGLLTDGLGMQLRLGIKAVLRAMRQPSELVQHTACAALQRLTRSAWLQQEEDVVDECLAAILNALRLYSTPPIQDAACEVIARLAVDARVEELGSEAVPTVPCAVKSDRAPEVLGTTTGRHDSIRTLLTVMSRKPSLTLQAIGCKVLCRTALPRKDADAGVKAVVCALTDHPLEEDLHKDGCIALGLFTSKRPAQGHVAIPAIVASMGAHPMSVAIQEHACTALAHLAFSKENQVQIWDAGGIRRVIAAMTQHVQLTAVQSKGCGALANLASPGCEHEIVHGISAIIDAMVAHPAARSLQVYGCGALRNIGGLGECTQVIRKLGGVEAVVACMQAHPRDVAVQETGVGALRMFCLASDAVSRVSNAVLEVVVGAMRGHETQVGVQEMACAALGHMAAVEAHRRKLVDVGGVPVIITAMRAFPDVQVVQEQGCHTLRHLASGDTKPIVVLVDGSTVVIAAMRAHRQSRRIQKIGCLTLGNLAGEGEESITAVLEAMRYHPSSEVVQKCGCQALRQLADSCEASKETIGDLNGVDVVLRGLDLHPTSMGLQKAGLGLLRSLAVDYLNDLIVQGGGIKVIRHAMRRHPTSEAIQESGQQLLLNLEGRTADSCFDIDYSDCPGPQQVGRTSWSWCV